MPPEPFGFVERGSAGVPIGIDTTFARLDCGSGTTIGLRVERQSWAAIEVGWSCVDTNGSTIGPYKTYQTLPARTSPTGEGNRTG